MTARRPTDLLFTLFGDYLLHRQDAVWVGSLIRLLEPLGLSEGAARTALSRMSARGWFEAERHGRNAFYRLTARGRRLLEEGEARIYAPDWDRPWDGRWFLLTYSIPESDRRLRDRLRDRLAWLGFGSLGNGLWISPHDVADEVVRVAEELDIVDHVECFEATGAAFSEPERLVARAWDLPAINADYEAFIQRWAPAFTEARDRAKQGGLDPRESFVTRFELTHEYREFPLRDPYLPRALLPRDWAGECVAHLFRVFHDLLAEPADAYVDTLLAEAPPVPTPTTGAGS